MSNYNVVYLKLKIYVLNLKLDHTDEVYNDNAELSQRFILAQKPKV